MLLKFSQPGFGCHLPCNRPLGSLLGLPTKSTFSVGKGGHGLPKGVSQTGRRVTCRNAPGGGRSGLAKKSLHYSRKEFHNRKETRLISRWWGMARFENGNLQKNRNRLKNGGQPLLRLKKQAFFRLFPPEKGPKVGADCLEQRGSLPRGCPVGGPEGGKEGSAKKFLFGRTPIRRPLACASALPVRGIGGAQPAVYAFK